MSRSTGVEITETSVRIAELEGTPGKHRVLSAVEVPIVADDDGARGPEQTLQALKAALKASRARRELVILGIPSSRAIIREIQIPFTDIEQIKKVIKFESESHLPSGNIDDVVVGFHKIGENGPRSRILIIAVQKSVLRELLDILGKAGIDPLQIDLDAAALFALTRLIPEAASEDENLANVVLDMGEVTTNVIVTTGEHLRMVRSMRLGSDTIARSISADLGIDRAEAKTVTARMLGVDLPFATVGDVEAREPSKAMTATQIQTDIIKDKGNDFARRIVNEVRRSLSSLQLEGRLGGVWLTGPTSTAPGLERELAAALGTRVRQLDTLHGAEHDLPPSSALSCGVPVGLALKGLEHDLLRLDFRQEEFRFSHKFERIRNPLILFLALALVFLCFLGINLYTHLRNERFKIEYLAKQGRQIYEATHIARTKDPDRCRIFGYANPEVALATLNQIDKAPYDRQINQMLIALRKPSDSIKENYGIVFGDEDTKAETTLSPELDARSALFRLDQFLACFEKVKDKIGRFKVDKLDVHSTHVTWTMRCQSAETFGHLLEEFKKLDGYQKAEPGAVSSKGDLTLYEASRLEFNQER